MQKIITGLVIVFIASTGFLLVKNKNTNQIAAIAGSMSSIESDQAYRTPIKTDIKSNTSPKAGQIKPQPCPCDVGAVYVALKNSIKDQQNIVDRNKLFLQNNPSLSVGDKAEAQRIIDAANVFLAALDTQIGPTKTAFEECRNKPSNIALYKAPPKPGRCWIMGMD